jgi:hypothetical protein
MSGDGVFTQNTRPRRPTDHWYHNHLQREARGRGGGGGVLSISAKVLARKRMHKLLWTHKKRRLAQGNTSTSPHQHTLANHKRMHKHPQHPHAHKESRVGKYRAQHIHWQCSACTYLRASPAAPPGVARAFMRSIEVTMDTLLRNLGKADTTHGPRTHGPTATHHNAHPSVTTQAMHVCRAQPPYNVSM